MVTELGGSSVYFHLWSGWESPDRQGPAASPGPGAASAGLAPHPRLRERPLREALLTGPRVHTEGISCSLFWYEAPEAEDRPEAVSTFHSHQRLPSLTGLPLTCLLYCKANVNAAR